MTLDEVILHAREVAERNRKQYKNCPSDRTDIRHQTCEECAEEHEQLAEWLEEYKILKELFAKTFIKDCNTCEQAIYEKAYKDGQDKGFSDGHFFGYNMAIDDFVKSEDYLMEKIKEEKAEVNIDYEWRKVMCLDDIRRMLHQGLLETAEQLKGGE